MNREQKIKYLKGHYRYYTMNSWNRSTSYAANVKIHNFVPRELRDKAYEIMEQGDVYELINDSLREFSERYDYQYQIVFNGRSSGYLVLINGGYNERKQVFAQPGKDIDQEADFESWEDCELNDRVNLVKDFDKTVKACQDEFIYHCKHFNVVEETIPETKTIKVLQEA